MNRKFQTQITSEYRRLILETINIAQNGLGVKSATRAALFSNAVFKLYQVNYALDKLDVNTPVWVCNEHNLDAAEDIYNDAILAIEDIEQVCKNSFAPTDVVVLEVVDSMNSKFIGR